MHNKIKWSHTRRYNKRNHFFDNNWVGRVRVFPVPRLASLPSQLGAKVVDYPIVMKPDLGYVSKSSGQIELYKANHTGEIKGVSLTVRTCKNVKTIPDHQFGELYYHKDTSSKMVLQCKCRFLSTFMV